ncbi:hypothetical protein L2Y94_11255 [Luteibacter aegosomatis]|uniref:hypothetical protein n=1 Tax=Luteibacter aegosomatis TaxID=2911537 RepID=UPI001FFB53E0|nr:hypothetical protein [Luteibacter aegosomatis]UPG83936.1 hypothetical protein L2Y94_11255 [Luteibacter aegosomatis]
MAMILAVAGASCFDDTVHSISDLTCPIRYIDERQGYFIGIEKNNALIGTAIRDIKSPSSDMPQADGPVENCSSRAFKCRSIGGLVFAIPTGAEHSAQYSGGPHIVIRRLANGGWHGSATCSMVTRTGCASHVDAKKLVEAYQYDVDQAGVVTSVKIQHWNDEGRLLKAYDLVLVSEIGLKLN